MTYFSVGHLANPSLWRESSVVWKMNEDYSSALDLTKYIAQNPAEVNILAFGYGEVDSESTAPVMELRDSTFYAGPITEDADNSVSKGGKR